MPELQVGPIAAAISACERTGSPFAWDLALQGSSLGVDAFPHVSISDDKGCQQEILEII